jgi:hypothetical protein
MNIVTHGQVLEKHTLKKLSVQLRHHGELMKTMISAKKIAFSLKTTDTSFGKSKVPM